MSTQTVCHYNPDLTRIFRACNFNELGDVDYGVYEIDCMGFYLYVRSERYDVHEYEASLRTRYGEYPVLMGKTPHEARQWIMNHRQPAIKRGSIFSRL
jgi:hypothetical protein